MIPTHPVNVTAKELPDAIVSPKDADGNFILGPTHNPAPEMTPQEGVPQGTVSTFTMQSSDSKIYPGSAREANTFGTADPTDPAKMVVTTSHPAPYTRRVTVYVPQTIRPRNGRAVLDNLIAQHRVDVAIVSIPFSLHTSRNLGVWFRLFDRVENLT